MPRLEPVDPAITDQETRQLMLTVAEQFGVVPNMVRTMGHSQAVLKAYLGFGAALAGGSLPARLLEQIALAVAEANDCAYCLAVHTASGRAVGLSDEAILDSRRGRSPDSKEEAVLQFARALVAERGRGRERDLARLRRAGYGEGQIAEIIAAVALNVFANYFNIAAGTDVDFPPVRPLPDPDGRPHPSPSEPSPADGTNGRAPG